MPGTLYLVATPIGNLADITHRALQVLKDVDLIACEDTRHTHKLLQHYGITTKTISYHEHNEQQRAAQLDRSVKAGKRYRGCFRRRNAVDQRSWFPTCARGDRERSDGGSGAWSKCVDLSADCSGLPTDEFFFAGFLPSRSNARRTRLSELRSVPGTLIFYEAPHRLGATLKDAYEILGEREAVVARELTKLHEEIRRGRLSELASITANDEESSRRDRCADRSQRDR